MVAHQLWYKYQQKFESFRGSNFKAATVAQPPLFYKGTVAKHAITFVRRGRDSNPRTGFPVNNLAGCSIRPLWHLSVRALYLYHFYRSFCSSVSDARVFSSCKISDWMRSDSRNDSRRTLRRSLDFLSDGFSCFRVVVASVVVASMVAWNITVVCAGARVSSGSAGAAAVICSCGSGPASATARAACSSKSSERIFAVFLLSRPCRESFCASSTRRSARRTCTSALAAGG